MNIPATTSTDPTAAPPPPPQPPRSSFSCDRHPDEQFNGFCPLCLCERLTTLDQSSSNTPSSSRRPSSASAAAAAAIKSLFSAASKPNNFPLPPPPPPKATKPNSFLPELRRTKSFSASKIEANVGLGLGLGLNFEPQRKSCDVRGRNTLWTLFSLDDENKIGGNNNKPFSIECQNSKQNDSCVANNPVFEETENEEDFRDPENVEDGVVVYDDDDGDEIRPCLDCHLDNLSNAVETEVNSSEIVEEEFISVISSLKPIQDHIDVDSRDKKSAGGGFWAAASIFSKKWQKWRRKQKAKKLNNGGDLGKLPVEKPISRQLRETQSEIADYGFGRRSCDTDPRFSLDAGRISFDDPRYSFDEPRASWDGYLLNRSFPKMAAPMVSLMEDAPPMHVSRSDMQIPVEEPIMNGGESQPGGSMQTKEYYSDSSSSRRRKSLDRSSSIRKSNAEIDELVMASLRDSNSHSLRDDCETTFELSNGFRDSSNCVIGNVGTKECKKSRRWSWRIWGFIHKRDGGNNEEKYSRVNGVERSLSESWPERNGDIRGRNGLIRSNSSVSWRNSNPVKGSFGSTRKTGFEINGNGKNRSGRYSNNDVDNGLLRFYLAPMRGSRRGLKTNNSNSIARSVMRLY